MRGGPLCVVVPHYSRADLLPRALHAVRGRPVIVVDDSRQGIAPLEGAVIVRGGGGEGFARAANRGLEAAQLLGYSWVCLLNDDAEPQPGCLEALGAAAGRDPRIQMVGPVLWGPSGLEGAGISLSPRTGRVRQLRQIPPQDADVDALSGACLVMPSSLRFDPGFPHGFEDIALAREVRRSGGRVVLVPGARCLHLGGATLDRRTREAARAAIYGHLRLVGGSRLQRAAALMLALAQVAREGGPPERLLGIWEGLRASRGVSG